MPSLNFKKHNFFDHLCFSSSKRSKKLFEFWVFVSDLTCVIYPEVSAVGVGIRSRHAGSQPNRAIPSRCRVHRETASGQTIPENPWS